MVIAKDVSKFCVSRVLKNFNEGCYIGVPMLQYLGLAYDNKSAEELNIRPYPNMVRWLREA